MIDSTDIFFNDPSDEMVLPKATSANQQEADEDEISGIFQKVIAEPSPIHEKTESVEQPSGRNAVVMFVLFLVILVVTWITLL